jgi:hypothetical protein
VVYGSIVGFGPEVVVGVLEPSNSVDDLVAIAAIWACRICRKFCEINYNESGLGSVICEEGVMGAKIEG